jgi:predicted ABC-type sugar transport system permease subunit
MSTVKLSQVVALFAGFTVMLVNGSLYVYGTMTPYIVTYLHYKGNHVLTQETNPSPSVTFPLL